MIKVFQVLECGGPGGTGNQVAALCRGMDRTRFETTLVYAVRPGCEPAQYERLAEGASRFVHIPEMVREISPLRDLRAFLKLRRLFKAGRPDVVHAHSSKAGVLARAAAWTAGVPRVFYSPRGYSFQQSDRTAVSRWLYLLAEKSVSWIGTVVAVSDSEAVLARTSVGAARVRVVRDAFLGKVAEPAALDEPGGPLTICALGRLSFPRRPEAFVRLAKSLESEKNLVFEWIGDGELRKKTQALADSLRLGERLRITGWLSRDEALERLRKGAVFIHYSRWEGLPNAVLEAMACGRPVVASDIPGNRDAVRHGTDGFLVRDEDALRARVLELAADPGLRRKLGEAGRRRVLSEFSVGRLLEELAAVYGTS